MTTIIQKSAVICRLNIRMCGFEKTDKGVSSEVADNKSASDDAGRYVKRLFAGNPILKEITTVRGKARNVNKAQTLRYLDGQDLLPVANFDKHSELMTDYKDLFDALKEDFFAEYETHRDAQQVRLGDMFDANEYPPVSVLRSKFQFNISYEPLSDGNTFDKMFGNAEMEQQMIADAEAQMQSRIDEAMHQLYGRLLKTVDCFNTAMRNYQPKTANSKAMGTFKDSIVGNMIDICEVLPRLNLTGDADLANYCEMVKSKLTNYDAADLREDEALRKTAADEAQAILDQMAGYGMAA